MISHASHLKCGVGWERALVEWGEGGGGGADLLGGVRPFAFKAIK